MKKVLITGNNSYIGRSFERWVLSNYKEDFDIKFVDLRNVNIAKINFNGYDSVLHLAAIVHKSNINKDEYNRINRDLTYELAKKSKSDGVNQFVFLSTMGVYGIETGKINKDTLPNPKTDYAKSKLEAEDLIKSLGDDDFRICILRPPIVYGPNCVGNYTRLSRLIKSSPIFPDIKNERSMIYVDELSDFIRLAIINTLSGTYYPQSNEYVSTTTMAKEIAKVCDKKIIFTKIFNPLIRMSFLFSSNMRKVFGSFTYDRLLPGSSQVLTDKGVLSYYKSDIYENIINIEGVSNE